MIALLLILLIIFILIISFLLLIKPGKRRDTSYFKDKMYAHRGLHDDEVPENSLWAFRLAKEKGFGVELDVQMTKDGQLVVFHDGNLQRVCGIDGWLRDYTLEELKQFRLKDTDETIPTFSEVLAVLDGQDLICEIKGDNGIKNYEICQKTYDELSSYKGRFCIESFSPFIVGWFKDNHPEIIRGQLSENFVKSTKPSVINFCMTHLLVNYISKPDFIAYNHLYSDTFGFMLCAQLYKPLLIGWTAKGQDEQEKAKKIFDAVIFEKNKG